MDRPPPTIPDYELLRRIGRGSYGEVWLARSVTGLYRAVKVIYRYQFDDDRPYQREFAGIKRFEPVSRSNDTQVDVLHVGRNDPAGYFYYIMELADDASDGRPLSAGLNPQSYLPKTLKALLAVRQRLSVSDALPIALSLSDALAHLHAHGLVHRDIKPSNIIFVNGRPKLADIGLIAATAANGSFVGTEGFVPREGPGTPQADIFALGKVLYEVCTGRDRLEFPSLPENHESLPDRAELLELNEVLLKACDPDPALRYASVSDLKDDLKLIQAHRSVRRLRNLEQTVRRGRKLSLAGSLATLLIALGWYQSYRFNRMAASKLAHVYVRNGQERLEQSDWLGALPWFAKALDLESGITDREVAHRLRIANTLEWCPQLAALCTHSRPAAHYAFFNSQGSRVLLCDRGTTAQIWDVGTDQPVTPQLEHGGQPYLGAFSPDGTRVATASQGDGAARLWNARTGALIDRPILHGKQVRALAFSPDGRWLATAGDDGFARLRPAGGGGEASLAMNHGAPVSLLAFSRDARLLLTYGVTNTNGIKPCVWVWDISNGRTICSLEQPGSISAAEFNPDGDAIITGTATGEICLWTLNPNPLRRWTRSIGRPVTHTVFSPDRSRLLVASDWSASLWDAHTGDPICPAIQSSSVLRSAVFSPDGSRFLLAGESRTAVLYDARTGRQEAPVLKHGGEIYRAFFLNQGDGWMTASTDGTVRHWRPSPGDHDKSVLTHTVPVTQVVITPDSRWIITLGGQTVSRWSLGQGGTQVGHTGKLPFEADDATLSGDGHEILLAARDGRLAVISAENFEGNVVAGPAGGIDRIVPNPRRAQAVLKVHDGSLRLWDWHRCTIDPLPLPGIGPVSQIEFSADGSTLVAASDRSVISVKFSGSGNITGIPFQHEDRISHIGFGANGSRLLVSSEDRVMRWWNPMTAAALSPPMRGDGGISFAQFSADQRRVFTTSANYDAMIWDAMTGQPATPPFKIGPALTAAAFSPDNKWLAVTSAAGTLQVWDTSTGEAMTPPIPTLGVANLCRFSPNGRWLITVEDGQNVICRPYMLEANSSDRSKKQASLLAGYRVDDHGFLRPINQAETARLAEDALPHRTAAGNSSSWEQRRVSSGR